MSKLSPAPKPRHKAQKKRFHARRDGAFADWIRQQPCILQGRSIVISGELIQHHCWLPVECCHVRSRGAGGNDRANTYAGCRIAHGSQHNLGLRSFEARWKVALAAEAEILWKRYLAEGGRA